MTCATRHLSAGRGLSLIPKPGPRYQVSRAHVSIPCGCAIGVALLAAGHMRLGMWASLRQRQPSFCAPLWDQDRRHISGPRASTTLWHRLQPPP